jgi:predicted transposase/invertase (TIGR01784 family)
MKKKIQNQHDKIVKETYSRPEIAKEYFKQFLPESLKSLIDIDSLVKLDKTYIQEGQDEFFSDLVFQFKVKNSDKELLISLLFEHKANPDKYAHVQVGHYIFSQWVREIKERAEIVPIIPFIYYQGKKKWVVPTIQDLFCEYPEEIKRYIPNFNFVFMALNELSVQTLDAITDSMLLLALIGHDPKVDFRGFTERLKRILSLKNFDEIERNFVTLIFVYKLNNSKIETTEVISIIESLPDPLNREFMSTYDAIKIEGKIEAKLETILKAYDKGMDITLIANIVSFEEAEVIRILKEKGKIN